MSFRSKGTSPPTTGYGRSEASGRAVEEYLAVLDDAAFGGATEVTPKFISPADPAARWTGAHGGQAFFGYSTNYLIDAENAIIVDVEATTAIRQAEVLAAKRMIERSMERFDLYPAKLMGDSAYGSAEMIGWLVYEHGIEPHVTVFDKSERQDGTFSRDDFTYDHASDVYVCPGGKLLTTTGSLIDGATLRYRASKYDCQACRLKSRCCPKEPARYVPRSIYEGARDMAREIAKSWEGRTSRRLRKKIEMLFAHLKRILKLDDSEVARNLPAGAAGTAAIYTDRLKPTHVVRRVILRQIGILNYVNPF